jgi:hypothetical protein
MNERTNDRYLDTTGVLIHVASPSMITKLSSLFQNYRYLDLLRVLCVCDGIAIPDNQSYIVQRWLMKDKVRQKEGSLTINNI